MTPMITNEAEAQTAASIDVLSYATFECALGEVLIARSSKGVRAVLIGDTAEELKADLAVRFPECTLVAREVAVRDDFAQVIRFLEAPDAGLDLPLDMWGTPFQRRVWELLRGVSAGRTVTYAELAKWVGPTTSPRAVAGACAANPIALAIPCHRVICSNGSLAGYRWGIERKRDLIQTEAAA